MGLIVALDIGTDKMVMAIAEEHGGEKLRLTGMKMIASHGVEHGIIKDWGKVKHYVQYLLKELDKQHEVGRLNVSLSYQAMHIGEHNVNVVAQRKTIGENDLVKAELKCRELLQDDGKELVDILPVAYFIDGEKYTTRPLGKSGKNVSVTYRSYEVDRAYLSAWKRMMHENGIEDVCFFPPVRSYMEALNGAKEPFFALADMGGSHIGVVLFSNGLAIRDTYLPLGGHAVDLDIMSGFGFENTQQAKNVKHSYAMAIRTMCKSENVFLTDLRKQLNKKDLAQIVQCRMEELLEGVVYQLQQWNFIEENKTIFLTGDGSRIKDTDTLLEKISGQQVMRPKAGNVETDNQALLEAPACLSVIGLLSCKHLELQLKSGGFGTWLSSIFK